MNDPDALTKLTRHLLTWDLPPGSGYSFTRLAERIMTDPKAHIDALVEARVLSALPAPEIGAGAIYVVRFPHEHDWRWNIARPGWIVCAASDCAADSLVVENAGGFKFTEMPKYNDPIPS